MQRVLVICLSLFLATLGARSAMAMGSMVLQPPASPATAGADATAGAPQAAMEHCVEKPDACCDFDLCTFFCATVTMADPVQRFTVALRMEPVSHPRLAVQAYPGLNSPPPAPPPRLLSLI
ncbi:MAG: hypothetical protein AB7O70_15630 [Hyphomicrobiales bacterium]